MAAYEQIREGKWLREFRELGSSRVRELMLTTSWEPDKRSAARRWLEKEDVKKWQTTHGAAGQSSLKQFIQKYRNWGLLLVSVFFLLFMFTRGRLF